MGVDIIEDVLVVEEDMDDRAEEDHTDKTSESDEGESRLTYLFEVNLDFFHLQTSNNAVLG